VTAPTTTATGAAPLSQRVRFGWLAELAVAVVIYEGYDTLRTAAAGSTHVAFVHAKQIISAERFLHLYWERDVQRAFLHVDWFIAFWNIYYGTIHFVMPVVVLVWLYLKAPERYVRWRNTLGLMFGLAVLGFWLYPLMPPRVMPPRYGFVDTAAEYYNFGPQVRVRFDAHDQPTNEAAQQFGNLYAAMPSFHFASGLWVAAALWPLVARRFRFLLCGYPFTMLVCILVTGNHWLLDAVGGWIVLGLGYAGASAIGAALAPRRTRRAHAAA